jgi:hypothetical protein
MKKLLLTCAAMGLIFAGLATQQANASTIDWTLQNATFPDGATLTGTFDVNSAGDVASWSITTSADPTYGFEAATTYSSAAGGSESMILGNSGVGPTYYVFEQGSAGLYLTFLSGPAGTPQFGTLPTTPGLVDLATASDCCQLPTGISNEYIPSPYATREVVTGDVAGAVVGSPSAPEPATIWLMLSSLGVLSLTSVARRFKTMNQ